MGRERESERRWAAKRKEVERSGDGVWVRWCGVEWPSVLNYAVKYHRWWKEYGIFTHENFLQKKIKIIYPSYG